MNNAERRLHEIEERLERFEAPEAPPSLIESIRAEIPADLGESAGRGGSPAAGLPWRRMAASLAVVALGGLLGYKLLTEGPSPGDTIVTGEPMGTAAGTTEIGEKIDSEPAAGDQAADGEPGREPETTTAGGAGRTGGTLEIVAIEVESLSVVRPERVDEIGEAQGPTGSVRVLVSDAAGDSIPGSTVTLHGEGARKTAVTDGEGKAEFRELQPGEYGLQAELEGFGTVEQSQLGVGKESTDAKVVLEPSIEETVIVTSESPLIDTRAIDESSISSLVLEQIPTAAAAQVAPPTGMDSTLRKSSRVPAHGPDSGASMQDLVEVPKPGIARQRAEVAERLRALGYLGGLPSTGGTAEPNDQPYGDMFFQAYGTNPFIDTEDDAQSTFGIDVDTASYTMTRSYLERGNLPPADAIRVEEFVNYFDYGDPVPRSRDFAVVAEGAPSPFASTARTYLLRFALKGREIAASQRKAAVLTFVVDVSGSMNRENRLGLVKRALRLLVDQLDSGDAVGLVVYGGHGRVILEPTSDHGRVLAAIENLRPGGSTNAEEGLVLGYRTARRHFRQGAINRVILCSDGVANVGATGPESILDRIAAEADQGIELTTVGFGMGNYNDVLMEQLADKGDGNYAYVDDLAAARRVFVDNLSGTLETIAGDAKIQVEFDQQVVQSYRLLGYENRDIADRDFRNDAVDAGEIGAGHQVTALYEVKLRPDAATRGKVATLRLRYQSKRSGRVVEDAVDLRQSDLARSWRRASSGLQLAATAAEFAEVLKGSYWARDSDLGALARRARELAQSGSWDSDLAELTELIERAARLRGTATGGWEDGIER